MPFSGTETVYNDPASTSGPGRVFPLYCYGDAECPTVLTIREQGDGISRVVIATKNGASADYLNTRKAFQCNSGVAGVNTSSSADATASGGTKMQSTSLTGTFTTRVTITLSTLLDALAGGVWHVYGRVNASAAVAPQVRMVNEFAAVNTSTTYDAVAPATTGWVEVFLGKVSVPEDAYEVKLALQAKGTSGSLGWDFITFVPADECLTVLTLASPIPATSAYEIVLDSERQTADLMLGGFSLAAGSQFMSMAGPFPGRLKPGMNMIYVAVEDASGGSDITQQVRLSYRETPRYYS